MAWQKSAFLNKLFRLGNAHLTQIIVGSR